MRLTENLSHKKQQWLLSLILLLPHFEKVHHAGLPESMLCNTSTKHDRKVITVRSWTCENDQLVHRNTLIQGSVCFVSANPRCTSCLQPGLPTGTKGTEKKGEHIAQFLSLAFGDCVAYTALQINVAWPDLVVNG